MVTTPLPCLCRLWDHVSGELLDTCEVPAVRSLAAVVEKVEADAQAAAAMLPEQEAPGTANMDSAPSSTADVSCAGGVDVDCLTATSISDNPGHSFLPPSDAWELVHASFSSYPM